MEAFWSVAAMPLGVFLCFSPVVIAWAIMSMRKSDSTGRTERRERH